MGSTKPYHTMRFVSIAGLIGAGKTTLANQLSDKMGYELYLEPVGDNPYLDDFYRDMETYVVPMQVHLLYARFKQQERIRTEGRNSVQDRTIYEDMAFAEMAHLSGILPEREYGTYTELSNYLFSQLQVPNVVVYLDVTPETAMDRISQRGRACERGVTLDYINNLNVAYESVLKSMDAMNIPVVKVDWNQYGSIDQIVNLVKLH